MCKNAIFIFLLFFCEAKTSPGSPLKNSLEHTGAGGTTHLAVCLLCDFGLCVQGSLKKQVGVLKQKLEALNKPICFKIITLFQNILLRLALN